MDDFSVLLGKLGLYFITVVLGLLVHGSLVLPGLYFLCVRKNPYSFIYGLSQALATAFGTSSRYVIPEAKVVISRGFPLIKRKYVFCIVYYT